MDSTEKLAPFVRRVQSASLWLVDSLPRFSTKLVCPAQEWSELWDRYTLLYSGLRNLGVSLRLFRFKETEDYVYEVESLLQGTALWFWRSTTAVWHAVDQTGHNCWSYHQRWIRTINNSNERYQRISKELYCDRCLQKNSIAFTLVLWGNQWINWRKNYHVKLLIAKKSTAILTSVLLWSFASFIA